MIKEKTNLEKQVEITKERDEHLQKAKARYDLKAGDKRSAYADKSKSPFFGSTEMSANAEPHQHSVFLSTKTLDAQFGHL